MSGSSPKTSPSGLLLPAFADYLRRRDRSERTVKEYIYDLEQFAQWYEKTYGHPLETDVVTPLELREWKSEMIAHRKWKPSTFNRRLAALRVYFAWARSQRLCTSDPTEGIQDKRSVNRAPKSLSKQQAKKLREAAQHRIWIADMKRPPIKMTATAREARRDKAILLVFLGAGLRLSELCNLELADVTIRERSGELVVRSGKGDKWRHVPLNTEVRRAIQEWLDVRPKSNVEKIFVARQGHAIGASGVYSIVGRLAAAAQLAPEEVAPHVLRHTFAKSLVDAGEPLTRVQALLGHESIKTTSRYTTPDRSDLAGAVEKISWAEAS